MLLCCFFKKNINPANVNRPGGLQPLNNQRNLSAYSNLIFSSFHCFWAFLMFFWLNCGISPHFFYTFFNYFFFLPIINYSNLSIDNENINKLHPVYDDRLDMSIEKYQQIKMLLDIIIQIHTFFGSKFLALKLIPDTRYWVFNGNTVFL